MSLIRDINNILEHGKKITSYKYATILGIFDYIVEHPTEPPINNLHFIPIVFLAKQFISYYYPFSFYNYYQGSLAKDKSLKVFNHINDFRADIESETGIIKKNVIKIRSLKEEGIFWINELFDLPESLPKSLIKLLWRIRRTILYQPLNYLHNVKGEIIRFFSIMSKNIPFNSSYDMHREEAMRNKKLKPDNWTDLLKKEGAYLIIEDLTYRELARYRFWAREVILKAWFDYILEGEKKQKDSLVFDIHIHKLLGYIYNRDLTRDTSIISRYRAFYSEINALTCLFSSKQFNSEDGYHLDHLLPWSFYPINRFWNLYPCESSINIQKSNNLPEWTANLEEKIRSHLELCLQYKTSPIIINDLCYFYHINQKNTTIEIEARENSKILKELISFLKQEWFNLYEIMPGKLFKSDLIE